MNVSSHEECNLKELGSHGAGRAHKYGVELCADVWETQPCWRGRGSTSYTCYLPSTIYYLTTKLLQPVP